MTIPKKKPNKQHDARAASFKRIAKSIRQLSLDYRIQDLAKIFDNEAKLLRSMR